MKWGIGCRSDYIFLDTTIERAQLAAALKLGLDQMKVKPAKLVRFQRLLENRVTIEMQTGRVKTK